MKRIFLYLALLIAVRSEAQDITGTWEGNFVIGISGQLQRICKMRIELVQMDGKVYGLVTRYPEDTRPTDDPNLVYRVSGKLGKKQPFPFLLFKENVIESNLPGSSNDALFEFNVNYTKKDFEYIGGKWFRELEPLVTSERGSGTFQLRKVSTTVSERFNLIYKSKKILDTLRAKRSNE
jgi:hypothetical protein